MSPFVTIAVITRNRADSLKRTLNSFKNLKYESFEVIVVDNASEDNTAELVNEYGYRYLFSERNDGFSRTRQYAVESAKGDYILWCDDDCVPNENWISAYVNKFQENPQLALIGGRIINHNFSLALKNKGKEILGSNAVIKPIDDPEKALFFANLNMAVRTSALQKIGGYDPFYKGGYEEVDLNMCLRKSGYQIAYCEEAYANHYHNTVSFKMGRWYFGGQLMRLYFYFKHQEEIGNKSFYRKEFLMMMEDMYRGFKQILSGCKRLKYKKILIGIIELFNAVTSRLSIPLLKIRAGKANEMLRNRIKDII